MKLLRAFLAYAALIHGLAVTDTHAQSLPGQLGFSLSGSFLNGVGEGNNSVMLADNDLTNGYRYDFDLKDAPASLTPTGPAGSAAFQWGDGADNRDYPHTSALWFEPLAATAVMPEQSFEIGYLYYRNGTIRSNTGASSVDLNLQLAFAPSYNHDPISLTYSFDLVNTSNSSDPVRSADIVRFAENAILTDFTDSKGNPYYLQLAFEIDQDTLDGTLSTAEQFHVFEGGQGRATLKGTFTTSLNGTIPEPSSALLAASGLLLAMRRQRRAE